MLDETTFRRESERALESLKQALIAAEDASGSFEFEDNSGAMNIFFEDGSSKFVVTPNTPVRQIWISAPKPPASSWIGTKPRARSCFPRPARR